MKLDIPALVRKPTAENRNATQVRAFAARPNPGGRATSDTGLVLGVAVSMIAFLLIVMPAVAIVALVAWFFQPRSSRPPLSESDQAALEGAAGHREQPRRTGLHLFAGVGFRQLAGVNGTPPLSISAAKAE